MLSGPLRRLRRILLDSDTEPVAIGAGLYALLYGLWYLGPASLATSPAYAIVERVLTDQQFGLLAIVLGLLPLAGVLLPNASLRRWGPLLGAFFWAFIVILGGLGSDWHAGGLPHFALAALTNGWLYLRRSLH